MPDVRVQSAALLLAVGLLCPAFAWADTCGGYVLGGFHMEEDYRELPDGTRSTYYASAPLHDTTWKSFRFIAEASGEATCADVFMWELMGGGDRTNDELWVAVYEDTDVQEPDSYGGSAFQQGPLKVWGHLTGYDWDSTGEYEHHVVPLDRVETDADIVAGETYWISVTSSGGSDVHISRGRTALPACDADKRGAGWPDTGITAPPPGSEFNDQHIIYADNCYEWSIWTSTLGETCAAQGGHVCGDQESCPGTLLPAFDTARCCSDPCEAAPACSDLDSDGYGTGAVRTSCPHPELDCDDAEVSVNPGMTEQCNGVDDDCDGAIDNGCPCTGTETRDCYGGPAGTEDVGACEGGTQMCAAGAWGSCDAQVLPAAENCTDSIDNDCNGLTDADDLSACPGTQAVDGCGCRETGRSPLVLALVLLAVRRRR